MSHNQIEKSNILVDRVVSEASAIKLKSKSLKALKEYKALSKQNKKREEYINTFYNRGLLKKSILGWKMYARIFNKESLREKIELKLQDYEENFVKGNKCKPK